MSLPPVTLALLVAVAAGHFAQLLFGDPVVVWFALSRLTKKASLASSI